MTELAATVFPCTQSGTLGADSVKVASAYVGTSLTTSQQERNFPIERFVAYRVDYVAGVRPVFTNLSSKLLHTEIL